MTNLFTPFSPPADNADTLSSALFSTTSGVSLVSGSASYSGANAATSLFDNLALGDAVISKKGILLTSGDGTPPNHNTVSSYSQPNGKGGDADLNAVVHTAFPGAGDTEDATVLTFKINVAAGVKSVTFDAVFGSDEYPEFSNSSFVDIAGIFVNGKDAAFFGGSSARPLSVLDSNLGYFQNNTSGGIPIEYDGLSHKLTVIAPVHEGVNTIKIAIADTGDQIYDSGLFISNIQGSGLEVSGVVNQILGTDGKDTLKALADTDNILIGGAGKDKLFANNGFDIFYGNTENPTPPKNVAKGSADTSVSAPPVGDEKDTFIFKSSKFSDKDIAKADVIADFDSKDVINVSHIAKHDFAFIGTKHFHHNGDPEIRYKVDKADGFTAVYGDKNGDGQVDFAIKLVGTHHLNDHDFVL
jgi:hypothetical protein